MTYNTNTHSMEKPFIRVSLRGSRLTAAFRKFVSPRRLMALILIAVMIPFFPMGIKGDHAYAELDVTAASPGDVYFYAPETMYVGPNTTSHVAYYSDTGAVSGPTFGSPRAANDQRKGYVNFYCEGASDITLRAMDASLSQPLNETVYSISNGGSLELGVLLLGSNRLVKWEATFTKNGGRYSYLYNNRNTSLFGSVTQGNAVEKFHFNINGTKRRHHVSTTGVFVSGVHSACNDTGKTTDIRNASLVGGVDDNANHFPDRDLIGRLFTRNHYSNDVNSYATTSYLIPRNDTATMAKSVRRGHISDEGYFWATPYATIENLYGGIVVDTSRYSNLNQIPALFITSFMLKFDAFQTSSSGNNSLVSNSTTWWSKANDGGRKNWDSDIWFNGQRLAKLDGNGDWGVKYEGRPNFSVSGTGTNSIPLHQYVCAGKRGDGDFAAAWMTEMTLNVTRVNKAPLRTLLQNEIKRGLQPEHYNKSDWDRYQAELNKLAVALCKPDSVSGYNSADLDRVRPQNKLQTSMQPSVYRAAHTGAQLGAETSNPTPVVHGSNVVGKYDQSLSIKGYRYPPVKVSVPGSTATGTDQHLPDGAEDDLSLTPNHETRMAPDAPLKDSKYPGGPLNKNISKSLQWIWWLDPIEYTIKYDAGDHGLIGEDQPVMSDVTVKYDAPDDDSDIGRASRLKDCEFTPESGYAFTGWLIDGKLYDEGDYIHNLTDVDGQEIKAVAQWKTQVDREIPLTVVPNSGAAIEAFETDMYSVDIAWQTDDPSWSEDPTEEGDPDETEDPSGEGDPEGTGDPSGEGDPEEGTEDPSGTGDSERMDPLSGTGDSEGTEDPSGDGDAGGTEDPSEDGDSEGTEDPTEDGDAGGTEDPSEDGDPDGTEGPSDGDETEDPNGENGVVLERKFNYNYEYTAILTITAKDGYTLNGIPEEAIDYFTINGADSVEYLGLEDGVARVKVVYKIPAYDVAIEGNNIYHSDLRVYVRDNPEGDVTYQWNRDGQAIDGATDNTYRLSGDDIDKRITVTANIESVENSEVTSKPTYDVLRKSVHIQGTTAADKEYNGDNIATIANAGNVEGLVAGDNVTISEGTSLFDDKNVGTVKPVTFKSFGLGGADANNYELADQPEAASAKILKKVITVTPVDGQEKYYGESDPLSFAYEFSGAVQKEAPSFTGALGRSGNDLHGEHPITLGDLRLKNEDDASEAEGFLADNYQLAFSDTEVNFTIKSFNPEDSATVTPTNGSDYWYKDGMEEAILLTAPEGYQISRSNALADNHWSESVPLDDEDNTVSNVHYYLKSDDTNAISDEKEVSYKVDMTKPYAGVKYKEYEMANFLGVDEGAVYNRFFNRNQLTMEVDAGDATSGVNRIEYQLVNVDVARKNEPNPNNWREIENNQVVRANTSGRFILYVRVTDNAGNEKLYADGLVAYRNSQILTEKIEFSKTSTEDVSADVYIHTNTVDSVSIAPATNDLEGPVILNEDDYIVDENEITFKADCLDRFAPGEYTITISYNPFGEKYKNDAEEDADGINERPNTTSIGLRVFKSEQDAFAINGLAEKYTWGDEDFTLGVSGGSGDGAESFSVDEGGVLTMTDEGKFAINKVGAATVTAKKEADDIYYGTAVASEIVVEPREISEVKVSLSGETVYTGSRIAPDVKITDGAIRITDEDYEVVYGDNVAAGINAGSVTIKGKGNYTGEKTVNFDIERTMVNLDGSSITIEGDTFTFTGKPITPAVTSVTINDEKLPLSDFDISYGNNIDIGVASVTAATKASGNYKGSVSTTFRIIPPVENANTEPKDKEEAEDVKEAVAYAVKFNVNGGKALNKAQRVRKVTSGKVIGRLPVPKRSSLYTFKGWYTKKAGGKKISSQTIISRNATYYAHWSKKVKYGTVKNATALHIRKAPSLHTDVSTVVGYLKGGQTFRIFGMVNKKGTANDWYIIKHKGKLAYVYAPYVKISWQ